MRLVLRCLTKESTKLLMVALFDDFVVVGAPKDMRTLLSDAARLRQELDAELAPAKCVGWCPSGAPPPPGWKAAWVTEGVTQYSVPPGCHAFVRAGVEEPVVEQRRLIDASAALPSSAPQTQLLLLRLCAGLRVHHCLLAQPLEEGAQRSAAVDGDAWAVLKGLLTDALDDPDVVAALLKREALNRAMVGMGIGGHARVVSAAVLAPWTDALRAGSKHSPALRALGRWLRTRKDGADGEAEEGAGGDGAGAPPPSEKALAARAAEGRVGSASPRAGESPPLMAAARAAPAARRGMSGVGSRTARPTLGLSPNPRGRCRPRLSSLSPATWCAGLAAAGFSFAAARHILDAPRPIPGDTTPPAHVLLP